MLVVQFRAAQESIRSIEPGECRARWTKGWTNSGSIGLESSRSGLLRWMAKTFSEPFITELRRFIRLLVLG
jgi:hypothetical protein